jgi:hypothetical protein
MEFNNTSKKVRETRGVTIAYLAKTELSFRP